MINKMSEVQPFNSQNFGDTESLSQDEEENEFESRTLELSHIGANGVLPNLGGGHALNNGAAGLPGVHNPGPAGHLHHGDGLPGLQQGGGLSVLPGLDTGAVGADIGETDDDVGKEVDLPSMQGNSQENDEENEYEDAEDDEDDNEDNDEDDDDDVATGPAQGVYDPSEFDHLPVTQEIKDLFVNILKYTPQAVDMETKFRPFIPDYIPAVGDIDAFIRVPRPDGKLEPLGLNVLDEPSAIQSDPNVLELQLRVLSKQSARTTAHVKRVVAGEQGGKEVEKWIKDIRDLHRSKPNPSVQYSRPMPAIDKLMQEWEGEFEDTQQEFGMPTAQLDCDIATQVDIMCSLLDIPIHRSHQLMQEYNGDYHPGEEYYQSHDILQL